MGGLGSDPEKGASSSHEWEQRDLAQESWNKGVGVWGGILRGVVGHLPGGRGAKWADVMQCIDRCEDPTVRSFVVWNCCAELSFFSTWRGGCL